MVDLVRSCLYTSRIPPTMQRDPSQEPVGYKDLLVTHLEELGFKLQLWEGLRGNPISELYSKFIFAYTR
jgi:hypothetical protein